MTSRSATGAPPTVEELREVVAGLLGAAPESIPEHANLVHLGVDSLGMLRLLNRFRRAGIRVSLGELAAEPTLAAWRRHLSAPDGPSDG